MVKKRAGTFTISSITSDLDALTIRRDPQGTSGIQVGCTDIRIHTSDPAFPEFVVPLSASIR
jgi:hypothetical protein